MGSEQNNARTAGPLNLDETGPLAGQVVVKRGTPIWVGTRTVRAPRDIYLKPPLDQAEVGTAWNGYNYND